MGCKASPLVQRNDAQPSKLAQYLPFRFFHGTWSVCIYYWLSRAQSWVSACACHDTFVAPRLPASCSACGPLGAFHTAICISRSGWQTEQCTLVVCAWQVREGGEQIQPISALQQPPHPLISGAQVALSGEHMGIPAC